MSCYRRLPHIFAAVETSRKLLLRLLQLLCIIEQQQFLKALHLELQRGNSCCSNLRLLAQLLPGSHQGRACCCSVIDCNVTAALCAAAALAGLSSGICSARLQMHSVLWPQTFSGCLPAALRLHCRRRLLPPCGCRPLLLLPLSLLSLRQPLTQRCISRLHLQAALVCLCRCACPAQLQQRGRLAAPGL